jgi:hypothetical protein
MPHPAATLANQAAPADQAAPTDPDSLFTPDGPIDPRSVQDAIHTIMGGVQIDPDEPHAHTSRRMYAAMRALATLHPRDEIELMVGVQALSAYHAAVAAWLRATTTNDDKTRHVAKAATAARAFDIMLRSLERRQARPLPAPAPRTWPEVDTEAHWQNLQQTCGLAQTDPLQAPIGRTENMTDDELICAWIRTGRHRLPDENHGLDIANTRDILPNGSLIVTDTPTPQQAAYIERRLLLKYCREKEQNRRDGVDRKIVFHPIRTGDLVL